DVAIELNLLTTDAGTVDVVRAAIERRVQRTEALRALLELTDARRHVHAEIVEEFERRCPAYERNAVLDVARDLCIAADRADAIDRNRNLHALVGLRVGWIARNAAAIGIGEVKEHARGHKPIGCCRANVEAAKIGLATSIEAVEGRS